MTDLIDRQAAIDAAIEAVDSWDGGCNIGRQKRIENYINSLPSVQPKRGRWIKISPANIYECSECGKNVMTDDICAYDFCHGCGAEMEVTK